MFTKIIEPLFLDDAVVWTNQQNPPKAKDINKMLELLACFKIEQKQWTEARTE
jgi:hypothetical protein